MNNSRELLQVRACTAYSNSPSPPPSPVPCTSRAVCGRREEWGRRDTRSIVFRRSTSLWDEGESAAIAIAIGFLSGFRLWWFCCTSHVACTLTRLLLLPPRPTNAPVLETERELWAFFFSIAAQALFACYYRTFHAIGGGGCRAHVRKDARCASRWWLARKKKKFWIEVAGSSPAPSSATPHSNSFLFFPLDGGGG